MSTTLEEAREVSTAIEPTTAKPAKARKAKAAKKANKSAKKGNPRSSENGLRAPQVRILKLLAKGKSYTRSQIAAKAEVDNAFCTTWIGSLDEASRKANEKKRGIPSLLGLKYVKAEQHDVNGKDVVVYVITASGEKALAKAE